MLVLASTKFYSAFKWRSAISILISAAAVITAIISVVLSLKVSLISTLIILISGVLTFIPISICSTSGCNGCLLSRLAAAAVRLRRADRHLVGAASILVGFLLLLPVLPTKFSLGAIISRILRTAAAATAAYS
jgi:hypothetical protein